MKPDLCTKAKVQQTFVCPSYWQAEAYSDKERKSYKYQFSVPPALHASDVNGKHRLPYLCSCETRLMVSPSISIFPSSWRPDRSRLCNSLPDHFRQLHYDRRPEYPIRYRGRRRSRKLYFHIQHCECSILLAPFYNIRALPDQSQSDRWSAI